MSSTPADKADIFNRDVIMVLMGGLQVKSNFDQTALLPTIEKNDTQPVDTLYNHGIYLSTDTESRFLYLYISTQEMKKVNGGSVVFPFETIKDIGTFCQKKPEAHKIFRFCQTEEKVPSDCYYAVVKLTKASECVPVIQYTNNVPQNYNDGMTMLHHGESILVPSFYWDNHKLMSEIVTLYTSFLLPKDIRQLLDDTNLDKVSPFFSVPTKALTLAGEKLYIDHFFDTVEHTKTQQSTIIEDNVVFYGIGAYSNTAPEVSLTDCGTRAFSFETDSAYVPATVDAYKQFLKCHAVYAPSSLTTRSLCRPNSVDGIAVVTYLTSSMNKNGFDLSKCIQEHMETTSVRNDVVHLVCQEGSVENARFVNGIHEMIKRLNDSFDYETDDDVRETHAINKKKPCIIVLWHKTPPLNDDGLPDFTKISNKSIVDIITFSPLGDHVAQVHKNMFFCQDNSEKGPKNANFQWVTYQGAMIDINSHAHHLLPQEKKK